MTVGLLLEGLVALLLVATIYYCVILNKRLSKLRDGQDEFTGLVQELNVSTRRAQNSFEDLRSLTNDTGKKLDEQIAAGQLLLDELSMITESGNNLANRMERQITSGAVGKLGARGNESRSPAIGLGMGPGFADDISSSDEIAKPQSEIERELLRTLREVR